MHNPNLSLNLARKISTQIDDDKLFRTPSLPLSPFPSVPPFPVPLTRLHTLSFSHPCSHPTDTDALSWPLHPLSFTASSPSPRIPASKQTVRHPTPEPPPPRDYPLSNASRRQHHPLRPLLPNHTILSQQNRITPHGRKSNGGNLDVPPHRGGCRRFLRGGPERLPRGRSRRRRGEKDAFKKSKRNPHMRFCCAIMIPRKSQRSQI